MVGAQAFDLMVGSCPAMRHVFSTIEKLAPTDMTVLVLGETGTGKELAARSLHRRSRRAAGPFVALNCSALPMSLLESEIFGFEKGAFTGAVAGRAGHVEQAEGGTLFLDEVAELPLGAQAKLLRVLQDHRVQRLGATHDRHVDVRVLAATHQDLAALVEARAFRRDLYHRLNEVQIALPPLRERGDDLDLLCAAILARLGRDLGRTLRLHDEARAALAAHAWPGNVRELENCLRRAAACCTGEVLEARELGLAAAAPPRTLAESLELATEGAVRASLRRHAGRAEAASRELGITSAELSKLARRFGIAMS
jgi:transcriptional regulator with GAF, ATPase, and Fis domain